MADQLSTLTSSTSSATSGLSGLTGTLQGQLSNVSNTANSLLDRLIPPPTRESLKQKLTHFATSRPKLAAFILSQVALSGLPLALFIIMSITVFIFAVVTGILVGVIGALVFVVLALGFGLFILLPTLFVTTFFAVAVWLWGLGAWYIVKAFNEKRIPGVHKPLGEGLREELGLNGNGNDGSKEEEEDEKRSVNGNGGPNGAKKRGVVENGSANGAGNGKVEHHADGKENQGQMKSTVQKKKVKDADKSSVKTPVKSVNDVGDGVADIGKGVTGIVA